MGDKPLPPPPDPFSPSPGPVEIPPFPDVHMLATMAMQGILASPNTPEAWDPGKIAAWAYEQADAMIAERKRRKG